MQKGDIGSLSENQRMVEDLRDKMSSVFTVELGYCMKGMRDPGILWITLVCFTDFRGV